MVKTKISITVDEVILGLLRSLLEDGKFRNRSHVIEYSLRKFLENKK